MGNVVVAVHFERGWRSGLRGWRNELMRFRVERGLRRCCSWRRFCGVVNVGVLTLERRTLV